MFRIPFITLYILFQPKRVYCREVNFIYSTLSANLHEHLRTEQMCSKLIKKCKSEMERKRTSLGTLNFEELDEVAIKTFQQIINEEITQWREKNREDNACAPVYEKVLQNFRMLEKSFEEGLVGNFDKSVSERSPIRMSSAQVPVNGNGDQDSIKTFTENPARDNIPFSSTIEFTEVPVVANEINLNNGLNDTAKEKSRLHKNGSLAMTGAQVPLIADEQKSNGTENSKEDTTFLITGSTSLRSAQVHVTDEEMEILLTENGKGEDTQLFTKSKHCLIVIFHHF